MKRDIGHGLFEDREKPQILHEYRVRADIGNKPRKIGGALHFPIAHECVHRDVHLAASHAAIAHSLFKFLVCEVFRTAAGVKGSESHIHRVRAVLHRGNNGFRRTGGREQLTHIHTSGILSSL